MIWAAVFVWGCSTPYRPAKGGKGYTDSQISTNEFQVGFQGNDRTHLEDVYDFALLRSAEISLQHGRAYFAVIDVKNTSSAKSYMYHQRYYAVTPMDSGFGAPTPSGYLIDVQGKQTVFQPGTLLLIRTFAEKPSKPFTYDAAELRVALRKKHNLAH
ncbi:MAG TPA: hypothetical protein VL793_02945 [Patescibacteria group bacterium]|nr:hypothetical protein [Patescibacteria group bacterium]